jgi:hypothetical protein
VRRANNKLFLLDGWVAPMRIERFLNAQNIERYKRLLRIAPDETQRRQIQNLLAEEEDKAGDWSTLKQPLPDRISTDY